LTVGGARLDGVGPCNVAACLLSGADRATAAGEATRSAAAATIAGDPTRSAASAAVAGDPTRSAASAAVAGDPTRSAVAAKAARDSTCSADSTAAAAALPGASRPGRAALRAAAAGSESGWGHADQQDESKRQVTHAEWPHRADFSITPRCAFEAGVPIAERRARASPEATRDRQSSAFAGWKHVRRPPEIERR
jgi:hypothetical protein